MRLLRQTVVPVLLGAVVVISGDTSAQDRESRYKGKTSFTGTYAGGFACDLTVNGKPSAAFLSAEMRIVQSRSGQIDLAMTFKFPDADPDTSLFRGRAITEPRSGNLSGYFERCDGTFGAAEIARILPARPKDKPFTWNAETVFHSDMAPTREGELTTATCRFVFTRIDRKRPDISKCDD